MELSLPFYWTTLLLGFILFSLALQRRRNRNILPGPWGFPLLGHIPFLVKNPQQTFLKWKNEFDGLFTISIFGTRTVIINEKATMAEIYCADDSGGLIDMEFLRRNLKLRGGPGLFFSEGETWRELRKFVVKSFSEFGMREGQVENALAAESEQLVADLEAHQGNPISLHHLFPPYALNAVWRTIAGETFTAEETETILKGSNAATVFETLPEIFASMFPELADKFSSILQWRYEAISFLRQFIQDKVDQHLKTRVPGQPRDMIDRFQDIVDITTDPCSSFHSSQKFIYSVTLDVLFGSVDTAAMTLEWLIRYAVHDPRVCTKIQEEIDAVVGQNRRPVYTDQANMPFTEACILETLRIRPVGPFGIPKRSRTDLPVRGKVIPKGTMVVVNIMGMNNDPAVWENPGDFMPERFLTSDGVINSDVKKNLCSFVPSRRNCPGEKFAYQTLFLMITYLLQSFDLVVNEPISFDATPGFLAWPVKTISVAFKPRVA